MGADGADAHGIAHSKKQDYCFPTWSPDGQTIVFSVLNRVGSQGIVTGEEKPRCEQWSGEYQIFAMGGDGKVKMLSDVKAMGTRPSFGRVAGQ
jgi:Tol biopolymer transport system component